MSKSLKLKEEEMNKKILGDDYFYEYGMDPTVKHLVKYYH
jgi:hypothetical protein